MSNYIIIGVVIILAFIVVKKKMKKERQIKELMNCSTYVNIVKPIVYALEKEGDQLSYRKPYKSYYGYVGMIFVSDNNKFNDNGSIQFFNYLSDIEWAILGLKNQNGGIRKHMAIQFKEIGVLLTADAATTVDPPEIPKWLMIAAKIFKESGYVLTNPDWFYENDFSEPQKYLNVMFR